MALELQIFSPSEDGYIKEIKWNFDELKAAIAAKVEDYKGLTYTDEQMTEAKKTARSLIVSAPRSTRSGRKSKSVALHLTKRLRLR